MRILVLLVFFSCNFTLWSQYDHSNVLPDLSGDALLQELISQYKPLSVLDFDNARDTLFGVIYNEDSKLSCVYSGHTIFLDPNEDPTISAYQDGSADGINTEHTFPRSKGADNGAAKADMYHLFPSRSKVNEARASDPFQQIPDFQTTRWFYQNQVMTSIPTQNIAQYSEDTNEGFEPMEAHKGNVARAMFYFYTMYKPQADQADPSFFAQQRSTLCDWHWNDPVDSLEWVRNEMIATYQDGKVNPFILDCSLASRSYCDASASCVISNVNEKQKDYISIYPNPSASEFTFDSKGQMVYGTIYSQIGEFIETFSSKNQITILNNANPGLYILILKDSKGYVSSYKLIKTVK